MSSFSSFPTRSLAFRSKPRDISEELSEASRGVQSSVPVATLSGFAETGTSNNMLALKGNQCSPTSLIPTATGSRYQDTTPPNSSHWEYSSGLNQRKGDEMATASAAQAGDSKPRAQLAEPAGVLPVSLEYWLAAIQASEAYRVLPGCENGIPENRSPEFYSELRGLCRKRSGPLAPNRGFLVLALVREAIRTQNGQVAHPNPLSEQEITSNAHRRLNEEIAKWKKWEDAIVTHQLKKIGGSGGKARRSKKAGVRKNRGRGSA